MPEFKTIRQTAATGLLSEHRIVLESYLKLLESVLFHFGWQALLRVCPSVLIVPAHQNRTHKNMHHAFKTWCIVSMSGRFAKSVTVVDTISTTVIFYLLPFLECFWHETGDIPNIFGHKQIVCLMEKYSLPELDFKYAVVKSLLTIYLRARTSPAMPDSPSTNNPTAPNSGHQWPSDACGSRYGS